MHRVVILGGFGFLGSHIALELILKGYQVTIFTRPGSHPRTGREILAQARIVRGDYQVPEDVIEVLRDQDTLIHLIHTTVPGSSMQDPSHDVLSNIVPGLGWMQKLPQLNLQRIIFVSTGGAVYGEAQYLPIDEQHPTNPISSYGITKLTLEKYLSISVAQSSTSLRIIRPGNVYGFGQSTQTGQGVIGTMAQRAINGQNLEIWGSGTNVRDYLHIDDFVRAIMGLIQYDGAETVFNCGSGQGHNVLEIVDLLSSHLGRSLPIRHLPDRAFDVHMNVLNSQRLMNAINWRPHIDLRSGIAQVVENIREAHKQS